MSAFKFRKKYDLKVFGHVLSADDKFLDLIRSLVDLEDLCVPHKLFYWIILVVAVSAEYLH